MNLKSKILLIVCSMSLSACQVLDPYTGESKTSKATQYGIGAALICGLLGSRNSSKHARNAAAGCGAIGASVGAYMDTQENELRKQLLNTGIQVERDGDNIHLIMPDNITFDTDQSSLKQSFEEVLSSIVLVLNHYPDTGLIIVGHTDSVGSDEYNKNLSNRRANAVAGFLMNRKVDGSRISAYGNGEHSPIASNDTAQGRAMNRRVELSISPQM